MDKTQAVAEPSIGKSGFEVMLVPDAEIESVVLPLWRMGMSDPQIVSRVEHRFKWLYVNNPAGPPRTWVVLDRGSRSVLGACSVVPHQLRVGGEALRAGLLVDFIVDPRARVAGPAVALQRGLAEQSAAAGFEVLFGYPNRKAWPVLARAGFKALGSTRMWARSLAVDPPRMRNLLQRKLEARLRKPSVAASIAAMLAWPLAAAVQVASLALEGAHRLRHPRLRGRLRSCGDAVPGPLTMSAAALQTDESPTYLQWRFSGHPTHDYRLFELLDGERCVAWAVVRVYDESAEVQTAQWIGAQPGLPGALWWHLSRAMRREGLKILCANLAGDASVDSSFVSSLFIERPDDRKVILRPCVDLPTPVQAALAGLAAGVNWHLFAGMLDI